MSIRQMSYEEGQALNIRECPKLQPKDTIVDELKKLSEDPNIKIVKSGKSYFDVTSKPEIFDAAHDDFKLEELTKIDQRDLRQTNVTPAFAEEPTDADPMSLLFKNTSQEDDEGEELERKTYYLRADQIEALRIISFKEHKDVSEAVRDFFDIAIATKSEQHGTNFRTEAEQNLLLNPRKSRKNKKRK